MIDWATALAVINVLLALGIVVMNARLCWRQQCCARPIRMFLIATGIYWALLYSFVVWASPSDYDPVAFGRIFVRPAFTWTLGLMLASAIYRWRSRD